MRLASIANANRPRFAAGLMAALLLGCGGNKPEPVSIPEWDPEGFAAAILEKLDKNGDGAIDKSEVAAAPGLQAGARLIDQDGDGRLTHDELVARFARYRDRRLGLTSKELRVSYNGRPLAGAEVRLVPEFFLADMLETATGTTVAQGIVHPSIPDQQMALVRVGYFRVEVTSPKVKLPAKFNTATTVGVEVSPFADEAAASDVIEIQLRDRA
jgi:hypothetical protein